MSCLQEKHKKSKKDDKLLREAKKFLKQSKMALYAIDLLMQSTVRFAAICYYMLKPC